jgi:hypothetical protein
LPAIASTAARANQQKSGVFARNAAARDMSRG